MHFVNTCFTNLAATTRNTKGTTQNLPLDNDKAPAKRVTWTADAGVSPTLALDISSLGEGERWMRSSTSPMPAYLTTSPRTNSWEKLKTATKVVAEDLLLVLPPC